MHIRTFSFGHQHPSSARLILSQINDRIYFNVRDNACRYIRTPLYSRQDGPAALFIENYNITPRPSNRRRKRGGCCICTSICNFHGTNRFHAKTNTGVPVIVAATTRPPSLRRRHLIFENVVPTIVYQLYDWKMLVYQKCLIHTLEKVYLYKTHTMAISPVLFTVKWNSACFVFCFRSKRIDVISFSRSPWVRSRAIQILNVCVCVCVWFVFVWFVQIVKHRPI